MSKYKVKVKDGDEEYDQEIKIDTEKQTETYHIPKTKSSNAGEVDEVYDFKRVSELMSLTMTSNFQRRSCRRKVIVFIKSLILWVYLFILIIYLFAILRQAGSVQL